MSQPRPTKEIFEDLYQRELSDSEVADMQFNLYGFFKTLYKVDQRIKRQENLMKGSQNGTENGDGKVSGSATKGL
jgi:hypothetical protein